jgi:hypothetical protein
LGIRNSSGRRSSGRRKNSSTARKRSWKKRKARRRKMIAAAVCLSWIRSIKSVNMSSDNEYEIRELRKEIDYLAEDVERLKRLVKNMKDVNSLKLTADDEKYLRGID